ncbi:fimbrial biogenesis chaperone [Photobacterium angustum]|nr:molecular chaperone [Photobacterium angustum]
MKVIFVFFLVMFTLPCLANMKVAPLRVVTSEPNITQKFLVSNTGDQPIRIRVSADYLSTPNNSYLTRHKEITKEAEDLTPYLRISPPVLSRLMPNERRVVRLRVNDVPNDFPSGEYRTHLHFKQELINPIKANNMNNNDGLALNLTMLVNSSVPIYYQKKGLNKPTVPVVQCNDGKLKITNNSKYQLKVELKNTKTYKKYILLRQSDLALNYDGKTNVTINDEQIKTCS